MKELMKLLMIESLADNIDIKEVIEKYGLFLKESDTYFARYINGEGLDIRIWLSDLTNDREFRVDINGRIQADVPEELLNDLIITELQIP